MKDSKLIQILVEETLSALPENSIESSGLIHLDQYFDRKSSMKDEDDLEGKIYSAFYDQDIKSYRLNLSTGVILDLPENLNELTRLQFEGECLVSDLGVEFNSIFTNLLGEDYSFIFSLFEKNLFLKIIHKKFENERKNLIKGIQSAA